LKEIFWWGTSTPVEPDDWWESSGTTGVTLSINFGRRFSLESDGLLGKLCYIPQVPACEGKVRKSGRWPCAPGHRSPLRERQTFTNMHRRA
jgi:hypothetical protein